MSRNQIRAALLVLADGETFEGEAIGAVPDNGIATGQAVFNTVLSGYQEVISDPSYAGQIITFTYPHIGNYGVAGADDEAHRPFCRGIIVREPARRRSSWRSEGDLDSYLVSHGIPAIGGIDTRRLTRHLRDTGAAPAAFGALGEAPDGSVVDEAALLRAAQGEPGTDGLDLVAQVTTDRSYTVGNGPRRVVAYDLGIKSTILRHLARFATVEVVPASTPASEVLARQPDGVFLSNGPGDPTAIPYVTDAVRSILGEVPLFGICLGTQVLGLAVGAETVKLPFGHHGGNHPVRDIRTGRIDITSQNHNFAVAADTLPSGAVMTHVNLNDGVCEGFAIPEARAFSVQHHPEAGPGPHEASRLFTDFAAAMERNARGLAPDAEVDVDLGVASWAGEPVGLLEGHLRRVGGEA